MKAVRASVQRFSEILLDLLYPRQCAHCGGEPDAGPFLCWECLSDVHYVQAPFCESCGDPVPGHIDHQYRCVFCSRNPPHFDGARSAVRYQGAIGTGLRSIKYHGATWLLPDMSRLLSACVRTHYDLLPVEGVCYVPLHAVKERERGFNQAERLARALATERGWSVMRSALRRTKDHGSQTRLTAKQRAANVAGVFEVANNNAVKGKCLLLVDDVMTTGATVNECARILKQAGAASVYAVTVARG